MSELPRNYEEAYEAFVREFGVSPLNVKYLSSTTLEWFFDKGKASGLHNATKHLGPHVSRPSQMKKRL